MLGPRMINWNHPLAKYLTMLLVPAGAGRVVDLVSGRLFEPSADRPTEFQDTIRFDGTSDYFYNAPAALPMPSRFGGTLVTYGASRNNTKTAQYWSSFRTTPGSYRFYLKNNAGTFEIGLGTSSAIVSSKTFTLGQPTLIGLSWNSTDGRGYFNGEQVISSTEDSPEEPYSFALAAPAGSAVSTTANHGQYDMLYTAAFGADIGAGGHALLNADPSGLLMSAWAFLPKASQVTHQTATTVAVRATLTGQLVTGTPCAASVASVATISATTTAAGNSATAAAVSVKATVTASVTTAIPLAATVSVSANIAATLTAGSSAACAATVRASVTLTPQATATVSSGEYTISSPADSGSLDLRSCAISGTGDSATLDIQVRAIVNDFSVSAINYAFYGKVTGVNGKRPTFRIRTNKLYNVDSSERAVWTYDDPSNPNAVWNWFDTRTSFSGYFDARTNNPFTQDTIYIGRSFIWPVARVEAWLSANFSGNQYVSEPPSSAGNSYVANWTGARTTELGQAIPSMPIYSYRVTDTSLVPADGKGKRKIFLLTGQHPAESWAFEAYKGFWNFVFGTDPKAIKFRRYFDVYTYPMISPAGRRGGHYRADFDPVNPAYDNNRHWLDNSLDTINKVRAAVEADKGSDTMYAWMDMHGEAGTVLEDYVSHVSPIGRTSFELMMDAYYPSEDVTTSSISSTGMNWAVASKGAWLGNTPEAALGNRPSQADYQAWGAAHAKLLVDMFDQGFFTKPETKVSGVAALAGAATTGISCATTVQVKATVSPTLTADDPAKTRATVRGASAVTASVTSSIKTASTVAVSAQIVATLTTGSNSATAATVSAAAKLAPTLSAAITAASLVAVKASVSGQIMTGIACQAGVQAKAQIEPSVTASIRSATLVRVGAQVAPALTTAIPMAAGVLVNAKISPSLTTGANAQTATAVAVRSALSAAATTAIPMAAMVMARAVVSATATSTANTQTAATVSAKAALTATLTTTTRASATILAFGRVEVAATTSIKASATVQASARIDASLTAQDPSAVKAAVGVVVSIQAAATAAIKSAAMISTRATLTATPGAGFIVDPDAIDPARPTLVVRAKSRDRLRSAAGARKLRIR